MPHRSWGGGSRGLRDGGGGPDCRGDGGAPRLPRAQERALGGQPREVSPPRKRARAVYIRYVYDVYKPVRLTLPYLTLARFDPFETWKRELRTTRTALASGWLGG